MRSKFKWIFTLLVALTMQLSFAQEKTVKGVVTDANGPMPGVNVLVKGTQRGVSTGFDGTYSIKASQGEVLVFSFMGMGDVSRTVGASASISVKMQDDAKQLGEVVVTGALGIKKKKDAITSVQQVVGSRELTQAMNPNVARSLTAKVSGLQIDNSSGGVNGNTRIVLRGPRSVSGNTEALIVIDNAISTGSALAQLPPDVVESVTVIKGAQGAALYGDQGSNGVILVVTKKGTAGGKLSISVNSSIEMEQISFLPKKQSLYGQGWDGDHASIENGAWGSLLDGSLKVTGVNGDLKPYSFVKDNMKAYYQDGISTQNGVTLNFGGEDGYALLSANRSVQDFVVEGDGSRRNSFLFKGGKKIGKWKFDGSVRYVSTQTEQSEADNALANLLQSAPNIPVGDFENTGIFGWNIYYKNPFWERKNNRLNRSSDFFDVSASLGYAFNKHINVTYLANVQTQTSIQTTHNAAGFTSGNSFDAVPVAYSFGQKSNFYRSNNHTMNFYGDLLLNFDYKLFDKVSFKAALGSNMQDKYSERISQGGENLQIPGWYNLQNVANIDLAKDLSNNMFRTRKVSGFGNVDLGYADYLFLNLTGRRDATSVLTSSNNVYNYYSGGLSFVPTKLIEGLKDKKTLNYLKLFVNYAKVGNSSAVNAYDVEKLSPLGYGFPFSGLTSYSQFNSATNGGIKPEFINTVEAGASFGFLDNRLTLDATVYQSKVTDLISEKGISRASQGVANFKTNIGDLTNKGMEFDLGFMPVKTENFTWEGRLSYSAYQTKLTKLDGESTEIELYNHANDSNSNVNSGTYAIVGESFPSIKGTTYLRDVQGRVIVDAVTGMPKISVNRSLIGQVNPDYILGFSNSFTYKGLRLAVVADYRTGNSFISGVKHNLSWVGNLEESADYDRTVGFIYPNSVLSTTGLPNTTVYTGGDYTGTTAYDNTINYYNDYSKLGEAQLLDGTALKIREISLSYNLPKRFLDKLKLESVRFGVNARNPFVFFVDKNNFFKPSNNRNYSDPEASNVNNANSSVGAVRTSSLSNTSLNAGGFSQTGQYPSTRTFGFSVNLTF
ncbi:hypothetical protein FPG87_09790 [Flavobacterium psychrophilum]|uniref:SusC/RagA family TonB-linked outer membrane protein n=1 Tax=Flavobacterium psychrophilum TaxID=96345 RepID=UPI0009032790|nr:SusC/RagA family TonB-linked outer membrane protein [Flavobacterium psychrophilum]MCB6062275.1 SusC/RagA family TonB-linked outer membrane protein [Flavobacterium psychrophilum]OJH11651.1 hypothetical protein FPG87_09790 [Flavobacterium psychrophilum]